ncbi:MAG: hypothetical protein WCA20_10575 [Candidatus Sulfotelmatobacter sp.]
MVGTHDPAWKEQCMEIFGFRRFQGNVDGNFISPLIVILSFNLALDGGNEERGRTCMIKRSFCLQQF